MTVGPTPTPTPTGSGSRITPVTTKGIDPEKDSMLPHRPPGIRLPLEN
jgi:hypothetical protein